MGRINDETIYKKDKIISHGDTVPGSDVDDFGETVQYEMQEIAKYVAGTLDGFNSELSTYTFVNNAVAGTGTFIQQSATILVFSNIDSSGKDNTVLFQQINDSKESVVIKIYKSTNDFRYYSIDAATIGTETTSLTISQVANLNTGALVENDVYSLSLNISTGSAQVQVDWNETNASSPAFIQNKPSIPAEQINSDWDETDPLNKAFIQNKPVIPAEQINSDWNETNPSSKAFIQNKPTIPAEQVQANWNETNGSSPAFIQNKPSTITDNQRDYLQTVTRYAESYSIEVLVDKTAPPAISSGSVAVALLKNYNDSGDFVGDFLLVSGSFNAPSLQILKNFKKSVLYRQTNDVIGGPYIEANQQENGTIVPGFTTLSLTGSVNVWSTATVDETLNTKIAAFPVDYEQAAPAPGGSSTIQKTVIDASTVTDGTPVDLTLTPIGDNRIRVLSVVMKYGVSGDTAYDGGGNIEFKFGSTVYNGAVPFSSAIGSTFDIKPTSNQTEILSAAPLTFEPSVTPNTGSAQIIIFVEYQVSEFTV